MDDNLFMSPPAGVNGAGDFVWLIVSPPMSNVSIDMLEQELFQEELQNCGIHATFIGLDGIPGERDEIAAYSMEASRRTELMYHHVPHKYRALSTEPSTPVVTCAPIIQPSCSTLLDAFPLGVTMPEGGPVPVMSACWRPAEREIPKCVGVPQLWFRIHRIWLHLPPSGLFESFFMPALLFVTPAACMHVSVLAVTVMSHVISLD